MFFLLEDFKIGGDFSYLFVLNVGWKTEFGEPPVFSGQTLESSRVMGCGGFFLLPVSRLASRQSAVTSSLFC